MIHRHRVLRARLASTISLLAIGVLAACPQIAQAKPETTSPVSTVNREQIENVPSGRDAASVLKDLPNSSVPAAGSNGAPPPNVNLRGLSPSNAPMFDGQQRNSIPIDPKMLEILEIHNTARAEVGSQPLQWNPVLAPFAQEAADYMARTGTSEHSSFADRVKLNYGENLSFSPARGVSPIKLANLWFNEEGFFEPGVAFPDACEGDWSQCGHYTQAIWSRTNDVACGYASGQGSYLVCFYTPPGNMFGQQVLGAPPNILAQGPVINVNNPPPPPPPACKVPEPDDFITLMNQALESQYRYDSPVAGDAETDRQWQLAKDREQEIQDRMMKELATLQGNVAKHINDYLAATSAWQETYAYLASSTTGLQGLLTNWLESREIYEKADLAFGLANLGVGGVKLGFKAYKFFTKPKVAGAGAEAVATVAGASDEATALVGATDDAAAAGQAAAGATKTAGASAAQVAEWQKQVAQLQNSIAQTEQQGMKFLADQMRPNLDALLKAGPESIKILSEAEKTAAAVANLDARLVAMARKAGVNVDSIATAAKDAQAGDLALMRAIAKARGWHDIPAWADGPIQNVLLQARKALAGADDARISPQQLEVVKSLRTYIESKGLNFADWLRKAAGEIEDGIVGAEEATSTAIVRYFDEADIDLLLKVLDAGGDASKLRATVTPVAQASLNGLGRALQTGIPGCADLGQGLALQGIGGTLQGAANQVGGANTAGAPGGKPTDAQLENVLYGQGKLGEVGLGNVIDQFGVTDRFTAGQGYGRAVLGELWEFVTSPSATTASFYYTLEAQNELLKLFENEGDRLVKLGTSLDDASRALQNLQNTLQQAGLTGPGSYLGNRGPEDLRRALDKLQGIHDSASDGWKRSHQAELDARRDHINEKLAALNETVADLNALAGRMTNLRNWLDSLRKDPTGGLRGPVDLFNPQVFVRLGSISLFLRGMGADAFGLTSDVPYRVVAKQPLAQQPRQANAQTQPASTTDAEAEAIRARHRANPEVMDTPEESFDEMRARQEEQTRQMDEAPETQVDPDFDAWLNNLPPGK